MMPSAQEVAEVLGIRPEAIGSDLDLAILALQGLPQKTLENFCRSFMDDPGLANCITPSGLVALRDNPAVLTPEESDWLFRAARIWVHARQVLGTAERARSFLFEPHPVLAGYEPFHIASASGVGAMVVHRHFKGLRHVALH